MLTWPWVGRPSWSELGPAQLCLPGNHGAAAAPPPSPSLPSVHFDLPAPVTAKHNTRPVKMCSEQSRAALLLREGGGVSGPATRHPLPGGVGGGQERSAGPGVSGFPGCPLGALRCLSSFRRQLYRDFLRIPRHSPAQADKTVFFGVFTELGHVATVIIPKRHSVPIKATPRFALFHPRQPPTYRSSLQICLSGHLA